MKLFTFGAGLAILLLAPVIHDVRAETATKTTTKDIPVTATATQWKLKWSDEFEKDGLPNPEKWTYEEGFIRNNEAQYYTKRLENARIENGVLILEGRRERFANPNYKEGSTRWREKPFADYTAASLNTRDKFSWLYGRFEMRAKIPQGKGIWPAFWSLGENIREIGWPRCGEIDVMEFVGKEPNKIHGTVHFWRDEKHTSIGKALEVEKPFDDFHIYAAEWFPDRIDFFFNDIKYHTVVIDETGPHADTAFRKPHFLLINLALGGDWGGPIDDAVLPQKYLIDYVRVYQAE